MVIAIPLKTAGKYIRSQKDIFLLSTGFTLFVNASILQYFFLATSRFIVCKSIVKF